MRSPILATRLQPVEIDVILLLIRILLGSLFITVGWPKIQHPFSWMGPDSAFPGFFLLLAAISEFCGGIALILGFLTRIFAFGIACTMAVAAYVVHFTYGMPFVNMQGGNAYYINLVLLLVVLLLMVNGPGRFSLDRVVFGVTIKETSI